MFRAFCVPQISVYYFILNIGHLLGALILYPPKIKSAPTEVGAQKTQTPIVAKLINTKHHCIHTEGICVFIKLMA